MLLLGLVYYTISFFSFGRNKSYGLCENELERNSLCPPAATGSACDVRTILVTTIDSEPPGRIKHQLTIEHSGSSALEQPRRGMGGESNAGEMGFKHGDDENGILMWSVYQISRVGITSMPLHTKPDPFFSSADWDPVVNGGGGFSS